MRKVLNDNPVVQIAVLAVLAVVVAFLLLTRLGGSSSSAPTATAAPDASAPTATTATDTAPSDSTAPATDGAAAPSDAPEVSVSTSGFVAGPGLPAAVVKAYDAGDAVVLLVTKHAGIDDRVLRASVQHLRGRAGVAVFTTSAKRIADYARITEGVDVDRAPALVVLRPKRLTAGGSSMPEATVSYGFRGADSIDQAVRDAQYKGKTDLPFYP